MEAMALPKEEGASDTDDAAVAHAFMPWKVEVVVEKAEHLPKMDLFGASQHPIDISDHYIST
jgi:hypothetical protein